MKHKTNPLVGARVKDLQFLSGTWRGTLGNSYVEELWTIETRSNMTGMFRWIRGDEIYIYEIMALVEVADTVQFFLRHFNKEFVASEEKDEPLKFLLTELTERKCVFVLAKSPEKGFISYEITDEDKLRFADFEPDGSLSFELVFEKVA
ncbi:MAG: DUF6265 family protein [Candidatus Thorarchaeota archaeon]